MATLTVTSGLSPAFASGDTVTPDKLNSLGTPTVALTVGTIVDADISAGAAIAASKLSTAAQQSLLPAGAVMPFAMNSAPAGWLAADGALVNRTTYAALFTALGTTYGVGDGSTTFALPDLRGYFVRGSGTNGDGTAAGTFGVKAADQIKAHQHFVFKSGNGGLTALSADNYPTEQGERGNSNAAYIIAGSASEANFGLTSNTGDTETRPKNIALLYCVKF